MSELTIGGVLVRRILRSVDTLPRIQLIPIHSNGLLKIELRRGFNWFRWPLLPNALAGALCGARSYIRQNFGVSGGVDGAEGRLGITSR